MVVALLTRRGGGGVADLEAMAAAAVERFRASLGDDALVASFADVLVQQGLLKPEDLDELDHTGSSAG